MCSYFQLKFLFISSVKYWYICLLYYPKNKIIPPDIGNTWWDYIYNIALQKAEELGFKNNFMGADSNSVTFVGHGIGLELDEYPFLAKGQKMPLEKNMIIAIEPKAVFENIGAVGIENTCIVAKQGLESLNNSDKNIFNLQKP